MVTSVTLRFVTASDLISRTIRGGEMGFWASHTESRMPDGSLLGAHADGGVQRRAADYDKTWTQQLFVDVPCTAEQAVAFHGFLISKIGLPYDFQAIEDMADGVLTGHELPLEDMGNFICSALMTAALLFAKIIYSAPAGLRLTTPRDVLMICAALTPIGIPETRSA